MASTTISQKSSSARSFSLIVLYLFAFFRPIVIMHGSRLHIGPFNVLELFSIVTSYLLILAIFLNIRKIKLNFLNIAIALSIIYSLLSTMWGSNIREVARMVLPFVIFLSVDTLVDDENKIRNLLRFLLLGYTIFIIINVTLVGIEKSGLVHYEYRRGITRYAGAADRIHSLAHSMFLYSVAYLLYLNSGIKTRKRVIKTVLLLLLFGSFICIFKTYTRTVYVGLIILWGIYLWGTNKRNFLIMLVGVFLMMILLRGQLAHVFSDVLNPLEGKAALSEAGSGRIGIWGKSLEFYSKLTLDKKILGTGIGSVKWDGGKGHKFLIMTTHNDYLGLLVTTGIIGVLIHFIIWGKILFDVFSFKRNRCLRYIYLGFLFSVMVMNILSNSYLSRVELLQLFWLFIGLFYVHRNYGVVGRL